MLQLFATLRSTMQQLKGVGVCMHTLTAMFTDKASFFNDMTEHNEVNVYLPQACFHWCRVKIDTRKYSKSN